MRLAKRTNRQCDRLYTLYLELRCPKVPIPDCKYKYIDIANDLDQFVSYLTACGWNL